MTGRREARDRKVILSALAAAGSRGITSLGLAYLSDISEDRVQTALRTLESAGRVRAVALAGARHDLYRITLPGPRRLA